MWRTSCVFVARPKYPTTNVRPPVPVVVVPVVVVLVVVLLVVVVVPMV